jgi:carbonic anhydrase
MTKENDLKTIHQWDILALSCIDGRFIKKTIEWVVKKTGGVFDFRTEVGASKAIIDSKEDQKSLFSVINTSIKLHHIKEVWLIDHIDCGAYGGSKVFDDNTDAEINFHKEKLTEASKVVSENYPELKVRKYFVNWEGVDEA